jgi:hypothetical protein
MFTMALQTYLTQDPEQYKDRGAFFKSEQFVVQETK